MKRFETACDTGHLPGCTELGISLSVDDDPRADDVLERSCKQGSAVACVALGARVMSSDRARAMTLLKPVCTARSKELNARACSIMTRGVEDPTDALVLHQMACEIGLPGSCLELARAMALGEGTQKNERAAAGLYIALCQQASLGAACSEAAVFEREGRVVEGNARRAFALDVQGCDGGVAASCARTADDYMKGSGTTADPHAARDYEALACAMGHQRSCDGAGDDALPGTLHRRVVRAVMRQWASRVRACYERHLMRYPKSEGRVGVRVTIRASGEVLEAEVVENSLEESSVAECVSAAVRASSFPAFPGPDAMVLTYPFEFSGR